jgi:hypothetical protein
MNRPDHYHSISSQPKRNGSTQVVMCPGLDPGTVQGAANVRHHLSYGRAVYIPAPDSIRANVLDVGLKESDIRSVGVSPDTKVEFFGD